LATDEEEYNELQAEIQRAILNAYPNPERKGCPGTAMVQWLADALSREVRDPADLDADLFEHITHCSPCYREFLDFRKKS
jgi:hypothetical protein